MRKTFYKTYNLSSDIKVMPRCTNPRNPSCIDLILTNKIKIFQNASVVETALSDFHQMTVTVMKSTFEKIKPRVSYFRNWREFCSKKFRTQLLTISSLKTLIIVAMALTNSWIYVLIPLTYLHPARKITCRETIYHS